MEFNNVLSKAMEVVKEYPLCDNCLGSLFARLGKGLGNRARGEALRRSIIMEIDRLRRVGELSKEEAERILSNLPHEETIKIAKELGLDLIEKKCYICGNEWEKLVEYWSDKIVRILREYEFNSFLVGCTDCGDMELKQREIIANFRLPFSESVKNSLKREVGKKVRDLLSKEPDFEDPDIIAIIDMSKDIVHLQIKPVFIYGKYKKVGRRTSQSVWKYPHSVEGALKEALKDFGGEVVLHAAGREDVDVRALGSGRPFIAEIKRPKKRFVKTEGREYWDGLVHLKFQGFIDRSYVSRLKNFDSLKDKVYLAVVYVPEGISEDELEALEDQFKEIIISQRTPRRVAHRRKDLIREKKLHWVKTKRLNEKSFLALIKCQGGLYIKELISGDEGRTEPSFSSFLGKEARCVSLDVVWVQSPW
ncbi:hypothetical protein IPA_00030 [Ignicoccus pacificus DSM 13166]|uniref:tRNA pseudouridine(55) synthase n=1 Tax=Ignicoccus pacificus DSM 13166 TaxID=940294 RepID=A0A977KBB7_9CREN|nr:hypothetical protein IPA_00030 [Ignicoccus pacificus DSM 13166]